MWYGIAEYLVIFSKATSVFQFTRIDEVWRDMYLVRCGNLVIDVFVVIPGTPFTNMA